MINVPLDRFWVISGTMFYRSDDPTNSVKALKEGGLVSGSPHHVTIHVIQHACTYNKRK